MASSASIASVASVASGLRVRGAGGGSAKTPHTLVSRVPHVQERRRRVPFRRVVRGGIFTKYRGLPNEGGHLEPEGFLPPPLIFVGIPAFTLINLARLRAPRPQPLPPPVTPRLEGVGRAPQEVP